MFVCLRFLGNFLGSAGVVGEHGSILIFYTFCVFALFAFLAVFWHFFGFSGLLGFLGVLVSYEVTRGIILVVGTVKNSFDITHGLEKISSLKILKSQASRLHWGIFEGQL